MRTRKPHVAGQFYAGTKSELEKQIASCFTHPFGPGELPRPTDTGPRKVFGIVSPHAGYTYSGPVAAHGYNRISKDGTPKVFIVLGPNHWARGSGVSTQTEGSWETPLGAIGVARDLAKEIQRASGIIDIDDAAHAAEHSIEVQLPFIQFISKGEAQFIPICYWMQDLKTSREIARSIADQTKGKDLVVVASSDFTHHERRIGEKDEEEMLARIEESDKHAIDAILALDDARLNELGESQKVTVCGYGPITTLIALAKGLGSVRAELLCHRTSHDITGDASYVVGYSSIIFLRD